jgi:hypothetical protein
VTLTVPAVVTVNVRDFVPEAGRVSKNSSVACAGEVVVGAVVESLPHAAP